MFIKYSVFLIIFCLINLAVKLLLFSYFSCYELKLYLILEICNFNINYDKLSYIVLLKRRKTINSK